MVMISKNSGTNRTLGCSLPACPHLWYHTCWIMGSPPQDLSHFPWIHRHCLSVNRGWRSSLDAVRLATSPSSQADGWRRELHSNWTIISARLYAWRDGNWGDEGADWASALGLEVCWLRDQVALAWWQSGRGEGENSLEFWVIRQCEEVVFILICFIG